MTSFPEQNISTVANQSRPQPVQPAKDTEIAVVARDLLQVFGQKVAVNRLNLRAPWGILWFFRSQWRG